MSSVNPSFLALLFVYRKTFHAIAAQALAPGTSVSTIVCWVDAVLAHLSEATLTIAHGILHHDPQSHHHGILNMTRQTQDNNLRAAAQLPGENICHNTSPAVLILRACREMASRTRSYILRAGFSCCQKTGPSYDVRGLYNWAPVFRIRSLEGWGVRK